MENRENTDRENLLVGGGCCLLITVLFFLAIWNFVLWVGLVKILIIIGSLVSLITLFVLVGSMLERPHKKKKTIEIIQADNLQEFNKLLDKFNSLEQYLKKAIYPHLSNIDDIEKINIICQECFKNKNPLLVQLIVEKKWIASESPSVKVYTILKTNQLNLIENSDDEEIKYLLDSLTDRDPEIVDNSLKVLNNLTNQEGINYLCQQWAKNREQKLEEIIINQKYFATYPLDIKILTVLKTEQLELLSNLNLEEILILINTFDDSDQVIAKNAEKMGDFLQDPICKSLIYFITEQWEQYEQIDFDQNILKNIFNNTDSTLRKKISEKIKISGRSDWLNIIFTEKKRNNIELITDDDWQVIIELLSKTNNEKEKWKLAQKAPLFYSQQLLKQIHSLDVSKAEKSSEKNLLDLGKKVIANPSDLSTSIDVIDNSVTFTGHTDSIRCLVMNREGTLLASGSYDKTIKLWKLPSGQLLHTLTGHTDSIISLVMNREGTLLASASYDKTIKLWELPSGRLLRTINSHTNKINCLVINREGTLLASASSYYTTIKLWELPSGQTLHTLTGHSNWITSLVMNREGTLLASASYDQTIKLWELPSAQLLHTLTGHTDSIISLVMNRKGTLLASASDDKTIKIWELPSGQLLHTLTGHTDWVRSLVMNREGTLLASASYRAIKLWELPSGRLLHTLTGHTNWITSLVMNREGNLLASASDDRTIKLWKLNSLDRLPLSKIVNYYDYIQDTLKRDDLNNNQRNWFEFMLALVNNYRSFEIDIEDAPIIAEAGEFDIEIED